MAAVAAAVTPARAFLIMSLMDVFSLSVMGFMEDLSLSIMGFIGIVLNVPGH